MSNLKFKDYMKMNVQFNYLKEFYNSVDIASIYGVEKMEIKHNNFLKWLLEPKKNINEKSLEYLSIKQLLKLIQCNNEYYDYFNSVNISNALISDVKIMCEENNIDLLVFLKINSEDYIIVIENELESHIHNNQLQVHKDYILNKYKSYKPLFVFLHRRRRISLEEKQEAERLNYISITYQGIYDFILSDAAEFINNSETKLLINYYIRCLACYSFDSTPVLIVTDNESKCLKSLLDDEQINKMIDSLCDNKDDEYTQFYRENKVLFVQIFNKCISLYSMSETADKMRKILKYRLYIFDNTSYKSIGELLKSVFKTLIEKHNYKLNELNDLINLYPESVPLLIEEIEIDNLKTKTLKNWYLNNPKIIEIDGKNYYVLSAWKLNEYEDLKNRFNQLKEDKPNVYESITLE